MRAVIDGPSHKLRRWPTDLGVGRPRFSHFNPIMACFDCVFGIFRRATPEQDAPNGQVLDDWGPYSDRRSALSQSNLLIDEGASYQQDLWQSTFRQKLIRTKAGLASTNKELTGNFNIEEYLQTLTASYTESGGVKKINKVREVFADVEPFVLTINTIAQSNSIAGLVWGVLTMAFQVRVIMRAKVSIGKEGGIASSELNKKGRREIENPSLPPKPKLP